MIDTPAIDSMRDEYLLELLCSLPAYVGLEFERRNGTVAQGQTRDMPGPGRRCTVEGFEWFLTEDLFVNLDIVEVRIQPLHLRVVH